MRLAAKIARLRIFPDDEGRFDRSVLDVGGEALVVSQFTLLADTARGQPPGFTEPRDPSTPEPLVEAFVEALRAEGVPVETGIFGARMEVELVNDGPVTIVLDAEEGRLRDTASHGRAEPRGDMRDGKAGLTEATHVVRTLRTPDVCREGCRRRVRLLRLRRLRAAQPGLPDCPQPAVTRCL